MEASFKKGDGIVDPRTGLIPDDHRLDQIAAASPLLFAKRERCRNHLARMKRLSADVSVVHVEGANEDPIDEQCTFYGRGSRIAYHRCCIAVPERLSDGCLGDICGL